MNDEKDSYLISILVGTIFCGIIAAKSLDTYVSYMQEGRLKQKRIEYNIPYLERGYINRNNIDDFYYINDQRIIPVEIDGKKVDVI